MDLYCAVLLDLDCFVICCVVDLWVLVVRLGACIDTTIVNLFCWLLVLFVFGYFSLLVLMFVLLL